MSYPVEIPTPDHILGDKWIEVAIGPVLVDGVKPTNDLDRFVMTFTKSGEVDFVIESGVDAEAVVNDADTWLGSIAVMNTFLPAAGKWHWRMKFYDVVDASPVTYYQADINVVK
jgi:hypothetical protein